MLDASSIVSVPEYCPAACLTPLGCAAIIFAVAKKLDPRVLKALQELGRQGGLIGGKARARKLDPEQRREIARKAARARWAKKAKKT